MSLIVDNTRHAAGTLVVWRNPEHYLIADRDNQMYYKQTLIEIVRNGRVYLRDRVPNNWAPERIIELMKEHLT